MPDNVTLTGGCLCGAIRFESCELAIDAGTCHCRSCQRFTGSAFSCFVGIRKDALRFTKENPTFFIRGGLKERGFCAHCGSSLTDRYLVPMSGVSGLDTYWVQLGTLDHPENEKLTFHYGVETQLPWVHFEDCLPRTRCDEDPHIAKAFKLAAERERNDPKSN